MDSNDRDGVVFDQPTTDAERNEIASQCCAAMKMTIPLVVDGIDDRVGHLYSGMPDRLYLIDQEGKVAFKGGRGPFGFKPAELEQNIAMHLLATRPKEVVMQPSTIMTDAETWARLPEAEAATGTPLPAWARMTAATLPRTTATILELDDLHRSKNPLDPKLRAMVRWVVADANRCKYAMQYALADLKLAGGTAADAETLRGDRTPLSIETRRILEFARELTRAAYKVSDGQVEAIKKDLGEPKLVALVQLIAYGNFQDRLLLSLDVALEANGPLAPLGVKFKRPFVGGMAPPRSVPTGQATGPGERVTDADWKSIDFAAIEKQMESQRSREPRVSVPTFDSVKKNLPPGARPVRIKWSLVGLGHSPELAIPWTRGLGAFAEESKQDRVFEETLFWVITRELQCFY